jgi:topoisomerase-4 subunit A
LFVDRKEGFIGTSLKKDEFVCECSDIDEIIVIRKNGKYLVTLVSDKAFVGKDILYTAVFKKNDTRTIYNIVYQDGRKGKVLVKRVAITGLTRDKEYDLTKGSENSKILYFRANPNGEAEVIKVFLKPRARLKNLILDFDFGELAIKGRQSLGNILTKNAVLKITLKEKGISTLGGRKIWFDDAVFRLNVDERGKFLGEFGGEDKILVVTKRGTFQTVNFDLSNHFDEDILIIEKFAKAKVYSVVYFDGKLGFYYIKRFEIDFSDKPQHFIPDEEESKMISITEVEYPRFEINFGGKNKDRKTEIVEVAEFIGVKSYKAKGTRLTTYHVLNIQEIEPQLKSETVKTDPDLPEEEIERGKEIELDPEDTSQMKLDL